MNVYHILLASMIIVIMIMTMMIMMMIMINVVAERLEPRTSIPEVPGSSPGPAVAPLGKALYPHCLVFRRRL